MTNSFIIPTVDIKAFVDDCDSEEAQRVVEKVREACRTSGFFILTGHGVPPGVQSAVLKAARTFFSLPFDVKVKYNKKNSGKGNRGYEVIGDQILEKGKLPDLKEVCHTSLFHKVYMH
jgi:isopenicillin N synthase-like dioxygenase